MFESVLVANRGEIAGRVIRTCQRLGIAGDRGALRGRRRRAARPGRGRGGAARPGPGRRVVPGHGPGAGGGPVTGAQAVHPGYGFLAENATFARRVAAAGLAWVGPAAGGDRGDGRQGGRPGRDGGGRGAGRAGHRAAARRRRGGGRGGPDRLPGDGQGGRGRRRDRDGRGRRRARAAGGVRDRADPGGAVLRLCRRSSWSAICRMPGTSRCRCSGLADGRVLALGERDCSVQRRHQKVAEETPSPGVTPRLRAEMFAAARRAAQAVDYRGAGTVECLVRPTGPASSSSSR